MYSEIYLLAPYERIKVGMNSSLPSYADGGRVQVRSFNSWEKFEEFIANLSSLSSSLYGSKLIFRGQTDSSWHLQSRIEREIYIHQPSGLWEPYSVQRNPCSPKYQQALSAFLEVFRAGCSNINITKLQLKSDLDWWCLGRHHGLYTPLLDWTTDYLVAAYFAFCKAKENSTVAIWVLFPNDRICGNSDRVHGEINDDHYLQVIESPLLYNTRMVAQKGRFTVLNSPVFVSLEEHIENINSGSWPALYKIIFPGTLRDQVLCTLSRSGITEDTLKLSTLECDLKAIDHIATDANQQFKNIFSLLGK